MMAPSSLVFCALAAAPAAASVQDRSLASANPVRKVVSMLESMQKRVEEEGKKEKTAYDAFMCYCSTSGGNLKASLAAADTKIPALGTSIKEAEASLEQTKANLKQAQADRSEAKAALAEATSVREKDATAFATEKASYDANIAAVRRAVAALEKGMGGSFLQTSYARVLLKVVQERRGMLEEDRQDVVSFLSGSSKSEYTPSSGEVTGILKTMGEEMTSALNDITSKEEAAVKSYKELVAAKGREVDVLTTEIETKSQRVGEVSVEIVQMKNDLTDTEESLVADQKFVAELDGSCKTKTREWQERVKTRGDELTALSETIKILNDDASLEVFKKTLPSTEASLVQVVSSNALRAKVLAEVEAAQQQVQRSGRPRHAQLDLIAMALRGKKVDFATVIAMIDEMVGTLKDEQLEDEHKKQYCASQFDFAGDKKKQLERSISVSEDAVDSAQEGIAKLADEISALKKGIKANDKAVEKAGDIRKEEREDFNELMASNSAAKELLVFAQNRLNKFYQPKLYRPPAEEAPAVLAEVSVHVQRRGGGAAAPPPPPETFGAYSKKSEEGNGVVSMMKLLIQDLDKEMTEAQTSETEAQKSYEAMLRNSASTRAADSKLLTEKEATKADLEDNVETHTESKVADTRKLGATLKYIQSLHAECDWLIQYYGVRKEARDSEIDGLSNAKAVLSGADYSLLQTRLRGFSGRAGA